MAIWTTDQLAVSLMKLGAPKARRVVQRIGHRSCTFPMQVFVLCILLLLWNSDVDLSKDPL